MPSSITGSSRRELLAGVAAVAAVAKYAPETSARGKEEEVKTWRVYGNCRFGQIHFYMAAPKADGRVAHPLICLHESPASGDSFREFQAVMALDRLVICPDTPGYGDSDCPSAVPTIEEYGAAIIEALNSIDIKGPIDVLGCHTGTFIAAAIGRQRPAFANRLVMAGIPYYPASERAGKLVQYGHPPPLFSNPEYFAQSWRELVLEHKVNGLPQERQLNAFVERMGTGFKSWYALDAVFRYDADSALGNLRQPVLCPVISDTLALPTRAAAKLIRKSTIVDCEELDSDAWQVKPDQLAAAIQPFLART